MSTRRVSKKLLRYLLAFLAVWIGLIRPAEVRAQVVGATVSGTIVDPSGGATPGVTVAIKNTATGTTTNAVTNGGGFYLAPNLPAGEYEITASASGFASQVRKGIILTVGEELVLNVTMKIGSASDTVTVISEVPTVDLANATLGGVTDSRTIEEIPLNGRSWTDLANLEPGVHFVQDQPPISAPDRVKRGLGLQLTISGGRPQPGAARFGL